MKTHQPIEFQIRGLSPLMMHNGHLADPLNEYARRMKTISSKKNKTEADYRELAEVEWEGGLYLDEKMRIVMPGDCIESALIAGGKKNKKGNDFKAGLLCEGDWPVTHDGPKDLNKLKDDARFRDIRGVKIGQNRVMRTRPIFPSWSLKFTILYLPDVLNPDDVVKSVQAVGRIIGLGDFRPKYGRYLLESWR